MKTKVVIVWLLIASLSTSCATLRGRFLVGVGAGAAAAGGTATLLSPNPESRGLNALVFGLIGGLVGGLISVLFFKDPAPDKSATLKEREAAQNSSDPTLYAVPASPNLPVFVKERLQPTLVEESDEPDTVSEDGTLHAPHKVYRIERQAELFAKPSFKAKQEK